MAALSRFVEEIEAELAAAFRKLREGGRAVEAHPRRVVLDLGVTAAVDASGGIQVSPFTATEEGVAPHRVTIEIECPGGAPERAAASAIPSGSVSVAAEAGMSAGGEAPLGGDIATLRRRLELVLGGPPGFTTGAKAEVLVDLLLEFGRGTLVETLRREWITQFDTGPSASPSVTKPPPPSGIEGNGAPG
jgi:hypothetical protein